ncbi:hypothetical protein [Brucella pseudogrignonensis]|uniref:Uncharacterized protein n=1 Tax=Brucella pseudogrignonensis TaxID=419475 RepID=A0ABU1M4P7_9HYPH|nr:hypothetical protein [Brucella pseudogrignonensis]MDR6431025.1 hypothetical protein [Brucella pseudogrignonensis]
MSVRFQIAAMLSIVVNAVVFGVGAITVLSVPALADNAAMLLPIAVAISLIASPPIAWWLAPRLRNRYWQQRKLAN